MIGSGGLPFFLRVAVDHSVFKRQRREYAIRAREFGWCGGGSPRDEGARRVCSTATAASSDFRIPTRGCCVVTCSKGADQATITKG